MIRATQAFVILSTYLLAFTPVSMGSLIAFTDFNDSTIGGSSNIKTDLNWVLNGLNDPGDLAALNASGTPQAIFDANNFVQDVFMPGLNVGNGNTFWTTDINITVAAGFSITLTDVTFNAVSASASQVENPNRRNDYTASLLNPASAEIATVTVADTIAGVGAGRPLVTLDFADTFLGDAGTYTLRIKGGDFTGDNETGNHTGFDNLSINGNISAIPEPSSLLLASFGCLLAAALRRTY